jgi:hypothetical protein
MPVKTRSQKKQQQQQQQQQYNTSLANDGFHNTAVTASRATNKGDRRVKIVTPSFIEASTRTYKVYSPRNKPLTASSGGSSSSSKRKIVFEDDAAATATEALLALQSHDDDANEIQYNGDTTEIDYQNYSPSSPSSPSSASVSQRHHACLNPMTPISTYIYRIGIYNIAQTVHYKTAYILYDMTTRMYHVHSIISNQLAAAAAHQETVSGGSELRTEFTLPAPNNTIQTKYKSYVDETVTNFIMTMVVPSNDHDYYIQDDVFGVVIQRDEFQKKAFGVDSCFYDIEDLIYDNTSSETITGFKAFMLVPPRNFWYSPVGAYYYTPTEANTVAYRDNTYTSHTVGSILSILSQSS